MKGGGFMLKIAICDDESKYLDLARSMIDAYLSSHDYLVQVSTFQSSSALIDCIEKGVLHDIYLLDIYMPWLSGMSVAAELRKMDVAVAQLPINFDRLKDDIKELQQQSADRSMLQE